MLKEIPVFQCEDEERAFWATHDMSEYLHWDEAGAVVSPQPKEMTQWPINHGYLPPISGETWPEPVEGRWLRQAQPT